MISISGIPIKTRLARDKKSRALGLMGVESLPENEGMLFVFPEAANRSFWMKNTQIPLSIAYIDEDYRIINIEDMEPHRTTGVPSAAPAICALEMNQGWFKNHGIKPGDEVEGIEQIYSEALFRKYVKAICESNQEISILIPPPPPEYARLKELPIIFERHQNPKIDSDLKKALDKKVSKLFNNLIVSAGYPEMLDVIKETHSSIKPIIKSHKEYFNCKRPDELADSYGINFPPNVLASAQSPSYPSGHTTQAFYLAHVLSEKYPDLAENFYDLAQLIADSRIEFGVHFPSDNRAGEMLAQEIFLRGVM